MATAANESLFRRIREGIEAFAGRSPSRFAILIFAGLISIFTLLFAAPFSSASGEWTPLADALFTATTTVCVAGLTTVDMATHWSPIGNGLVLIATQIGALGVLTLASILGSIIAGRLGLRARLMAASETNPMRIHAGPVAEGQAIRLGEVGGLLATVAVSAITIELVVAVALFPGILAAGYSVGESIWYAVSYSAMAFTNTGITPNVEGLTPFLHNYSFLFMLMFGVTLGSVGFPVLYAISRNMRHPRQWPLHVKLTLLAWFSIWFASVMAYLGLAIYNGTAFSQMSWNDQVMDASFMATMARSGGFQFMPMDQLDSGSLFITDLLMFIGGGSASTAGGIKVTTLAVLFLAAFAEARGRSSIEIFKKRIPEDVLRLAVSVLLWASVTISVGTLLILNMSKDPFEYVLFDVISAFGTVGLSTGVVADLPDAGVYIIALIMFLGRVGTVTLAAALAVTQHGRYFSRPEERPIVG